MGELRKWKKYYNLPEIEEIRQVIKDTYSNKLLFIEETHQYFLDGVEFECVSNITHRYKPITSEMMAENCVRSKKHDTDPSYKYYKMTKQEILDLWNKKASASCQFGTETHSFGESMFYYMTGQDDKILPECKNKFDENGPKPTNKFEEAIVKFWNDLPENFIPVLAETKVFNKLATPYAGTFDILFYYYDENNPDKSGLIIFDYKTNEDLYKNYGDMLKEPFNDMISQDVSYYTLQLNLYALPLEQIGFRVIGRRLIWVRPDGTYQKIRIKNVLERLKKALNIK